MLPQLRSLRAPVAVAMVALLTTWQIGQPLRAATYLWDSATGTPGVQDGAGTWIAAGTTWVNPATATNVALTSADLAFFGAGGTGGVITVSGSQSLAGIIFGQTATTGYSLTATAPATLTLGASGIAILPGAQPVTLGDASLSLLLGAAQAWTNRSTGTLTLGGAINNNGNTLSLLGISGLTGAGLYTLQGGMTGAGGLTLSNLATVSLTAAADHTGATLIANSATLTLSGAGGVLTSTSGITLSNGNLILTNAAGESAVNRIADTVAITSNGGALTWTNPSGDNTANWAETLGSLTLSKGHTSIISTNAVNAARTQILTLGTGSFTHAAGNTSTLAFAGAALGTAATNNIMITGQATTGAGQIIGPWATYGTSAASQTDYASYNRNATGTNARGIQGANIAASAETTWTTAANAYTLSGATTLTGTRTFAALRYTGSAQTLALGTSTFDLATYGILNGGTGVLTISAAGTGGVTTPTGGDNTLFLITGSNGITISAPIKDNGTAVNLVKSGAGTLILSGTNTYTGALTLNAGVLQVPTLANGGLASTLGSSTSAAANLVLAGGTLSYSAAASTAGTTDRLLTLTEAGGTLLNSATNNNTLTFSGTGSIVASGTGDRTLNLTSGSSGAFTFIPVIVDPTGGGKTSVVVSTTASAGAVVLNPSANNTFTGGILIQNRVLRVVDANSLGSNEVIFGNGTTPTLDLRPAVAATATNFGTNGSTLSFGNNSGIITLSNPSAGSGATMTIGAISIGSGTMTIAQGSNLNSNNAHSLVTGTVTLSGNPTFAINNGNGSATTTVTLGALNDGGVARTITVTGGAGSSNGPRLVFGTAASVFTAGTNILFNPTNALLAIRLTNANGFGSTTNKGLITIQAAGGLQFLQNTSTTFNTNVIINDIATGIVTLTTGGTSSTAAKSHVAGTLSVGTAAITLNLASVSTDQAHSLTFGATTLTGNPTFTLSNTNGPGIGSLILGALNDGGTARTIIKTGPATLQLNSAATSMVAGASITVTGGNLQIGNNTALGSASILLGDGTASGRLVISSGINLPVLNPVTYVGGFATLGTGAISGPASGTGTISSTITINATTAEDTGHFQGGGGTLAIAGPIVTGGTSNNEVIIRAGNVALNNATGNTYTSLRVNAGATTIGVNNAIPTTANVALAELASASISTGAFSQTIAAGATWTFGGTGPTLENNIGTVSTGAGVLTLRGTIANNTGSLATHVISGNLSFGGGTGTFDIDSGHASSDMTVSAALSNGSLVKTGAGILTLTGTKALTGLTISNGTVVGGYGTGGVATISVAATGSLQLVNNAAEILTLSGAIGSLNVAGGARIGLELGAPSTSDRIVIGTGGTATTSGTITLDFYNLGALAAGTYTLLSAPSGLTSGGTTYNVGSAPLGFNYNIVATDTLVQLITTAYTPRFWTGSQATTSWSTLNAGPLGNWSTSNTGTPNSGDLPSASHTVIFSAATAVGPTISTTLDGIFAIDAMQFLAAPSGVTDVNVAAGAGGALTIAPATSSAGIYVDSNAGTATLAAGLPLTIGAAQTWNVVGGGANGSALVVAADTAFNSNVTKSGAGTLTLSGTNTGAGTFTLSAGTLNLNSAAALGGTTFVINGGTTLNNTSAASLTLTTANAITLNGNFTFTGTQNLNLGTGAIALPTNVSITSSGSVLTLGGPISESGGSRALTKLGAGALTLAGANTFSGGVNLNAGTLNLDNAAALGSGLFFITAGTLNNTSGSPITLTTNNEQVWNGNFAFTGTNNLNLGTGAVSLGAATGASRTITVTAGNLEVGGEISNGPVGTGITKAGNGALTLSGASIYTGNTVVTAGTLNVTGSLTGNTTGTTLTYGTVAGVSTVNVTGNITLYATQGGGITGAVSIWNQTAGTVTVSPGTGNAQYVASANGSYGYMNLSGGTYKDINRFLLANSAGSVGVLRVSGTGFLDHSGGEYFIMSQGGNAEVTLLPGGTISHSGSQDFHVTLNQSNVFSTLNIVGGMLENGTRGVEFGNSNSSIVTNQNGFMNLAAGTLAMGGGFILNFGGTGTSANVFLNFAGGTVKANGNMASVIPASLTGNTVVNVNATLFGAVDNSALAGAPSFAGGLIFDTNGFTSTMPQSLTGASGVGVRQADMVVTGGSGYVAPPLVQFSTAGVVAGGTPASGYALVSGGVITGIVITNPGTYAPGTVPTITLSGGGGTGGVITVAALSSVNTSGGLTVGGGGILTLGGAAGSYTAPTVINGPGTSLGVTGALANIGSNSSLGTGDATSDATNAASLIINGSTLRFTIAAASTSDRLFTLTQNGGALESNHATAANTVAFTNTGKAIVLTGSGARTLTLGGVNTGDNLLALDITDGTGGATSLAKTGAGKWIVSGTGNTFTGGTTLNAGTLGFSSGSLGTTGAITFAGTSTLQWNGVNTQDLSSRLLLTSGFTGTIDTGANNVTFAQAVATTGGTAAVLAKTGSGALTLNAAATHTGGTTLAAGTLNIGHASALGTGTFTISANGTTIDNTTGADLTLAGNIAQAWNGNFTFIGSHDLNLGTGAVTLSAARTVGVTAGTLTVGGIIDDGVSNFAFIKTGAGALYLKGVNTFGSDSNITIQGGTIIVDAASGLGANTNNVLFTTAPGTLRFTGSTTFGVDQYFRVTSVAATFDVDSGALVEVIGGPTGSATNGINSSAAAGSSVIKTGLGTLRISGSNSYFDGDGGWVVTQGTLSLAGSNLAVLGDNTAGVALRLNGGTVSYDTDTPNIVDAAVGTFLQASSTLVNNVATPGVGIVQRLNAFTVQGNYTLNVQGGANVTSGTAAIVAGATTLNGNVTFNITDPVNGGTTLLTLGAVTGNASSITLTGNGDFSQTGAFGTTAATALVLDSGYSGLATLSQTNTYSGITQVSGGTLAFSTSANLGNASTSNDITLGAATLRYTGAGTVDLTANRQINLTTGTTAVIDVVTSTGILQATGGIATSGSANLTKNGLGTLAVTGALNLNGGSLLVHDGVLQAGLATTGVGSVSIDNGATLNLYDGAAVASTISTLTLAAGSSLGFDLNAPGVNDVLNLTGALTLSPSVALNFNNLGGLAVGTYDLLNLTTGTVTASNYILGIAPSGLNYSFSAVNGGQTLRLTTSTLSLRYWQGDIDGSWSTNTAGSTNWATDLSGTTDLGALPVATDTLVFSATNAVGPAIITTLDGSFTVDSLQFRATPAGVTSVAINQGTGGGILTLAPVSANNGISVADNAGAITIAAPVRATASQTWEVIGTGANGSSLVLSGPVTFTGSVTKTGAGTVTLSGANTGAGGFNLAAGTLNINTATALGTGRFTIEAGTTFTNGSAASITLSTNNLQTWNGSFTFGGTVNLNLGTGAVTMGNNLTATVANTLTVGGAIDDGASTYSLTKAGAGTLVLNGANGYDGLTSITAGTLTLAGSNTGAAGGVTLTTGTLNINHAAALGTGVLTINGGTLNNSSAAAITLSTNNLQNWNGSFTYTGTRDLNLGTGEVTLNATPSVTVTASNLTVGGGIVGSFGLSKLGAGTLTLAGLSATAADNYLGTTTLDNGITTLTSTAAFTGGLTIGSASSITTAATFNLNAASATFAGPVLMQTTSSTASTINIGTGRTLTTNANITIGGSGANSRLSASGAGSWIASGTGLTLRVGGSGTAASTHILNLSGLSTFDANLGVTGAFRLGNSETTASVSDTITFQLAATSTLKAGTLDVGSNTYHGGTHTLTLGTGVNTINVNTFDVGSRETSTTARRGSGVVNFAHATNGSLILRGYDGSSAVTLNLVNSSAATNAEPNASFLLAGHQSDLLISTLTMASRTPASTTDTTSSLATLTFDLGAFNAATVIMSNRGGASYTTGGTTANATFGGGTVTLGTVTMSQNSGTNANSSGSAVSTLTFNGNGTNTITTLNMGQVTLTGSAATNGTQSTLVHSGTATTTIDTLNMGVNSATVAVGTSTSAVSTINVSGGSLSITNNLTMGTTTVNANNVATASVNITGGTLTVGGNIQYTNGVGTEDNTVILAGGTLDMTNGSIGATGALISFSAQFGTLQNVAQINGGSGGLTKTTAGTLILEGTNTYTGGTTISEGVLQVGTGSTTGTLGVGAIANNATLTFNRGGTYTVGDIITGSGTVIQAGPGTVALSAANSYTGKTIITAGSLSIASEDNLGSNALAAAADHLLLNGGTLFTTATLAINDTNRGITVGPAGGAIEVASGTTTTITNVITGNGDLTKQGEGTLIYTAVNTGTGTTSVNAGILGGTGTIGGDLIVNTNGTIAPGVAGAGVLTVTGNITVTGGTLSNELGGATYNAATAIRAAMNADGNLNSFINNVPTDWEAYITGSTAHDHIQINGSSASVINGTVKISALLPGYVPAYGDIFDLMDWSFAGPLTGSPSFDFGDVSLSPGLGFNTDLFLSNGIIVVVPEPSRALFLLLGLLGLTLRRRRY